MFNFQIHSQFKKAKKIYRLKKLILMRNHQKILFKINLLGAQILISISIIDHNKLKAMKFLKLVLIKISLKKNSISAHKIYLKL